MPKYFGLSTTQNVADKVVPRPCCRGGAFAGLALLLLFGTTLGAKHGNYIGCFDLSLMELSADNSQVRSTAVSTAATVLEQQYCLGWKVVITK
jgi:hypothetical protein